MNCRYFFRFSGLSTKRKAEIAKLKICKWALAIAFLLIGCRSSDLSESKHFDNVVIQGQPPFEEQVQKALALLKTQSPQGYATVTNYIGIIREHEHSGMQVHHKPPVFQLNGKSAFYSVSWCAGVIAHDSYHSKLYFDYKNQHPWTISVQDKIYSGEQAELACLEHQLSVLKDIGAPTNEIAWCQQCQTQTNQYWKVGYQKRNW